MKLQKVLKSVVLFTFVMLVVLVSDGKAAVYQDKALSASHLNVYTKAKPSIAEDSTIFVNSHQQVSLALFLPVRRVTGGGSEATCPFVPDLRPGLKLWETGGQLGRLRKDFGGELG